MTVDNNYAIAIATRIDWLKNLAPVRSKTTTNRSLQARFFPSINWFIALFATVVIGRSTFENALKIDLGARVMVLGACGRPQSRLPR